MPSVVITGASSGIGAAAAVDMARMGCRVFALGRSGAKLADVYREMVRVAPRGTSLPPPVAADFASLAEVRRASERVLDECDEIGALVNNAGIQPTRRQLSADGFELTLAVNHLAPFLMTHLLLDRLKASSGRVVTTASHNHETGAFDWNDLQMKREWKKMAAYDRSKLANVWFTLELGSRTGLPATSFCPGSITTHLNRDSRLFPIVKPLERFYYRPPSEGADTLVWLTTSDEGGAPRAPYYHRREQAELGGLGGDRTLSARLWEVSEELTGVKNGHARAALRTAQL
jgi:NAD(P)-dependent dehydrogenase (short-subunit alcohol dehydrogenase family)